MPADECCRAQIGAILQHLLQPAYWNSEPSPQGPPPPRLSAVQGRLHQISLDERVKIAVEHGIGVLKAPYLPLEQSAELITLQRDIKRVFDPQGLLNPGKIFPSGSHKAC